MLFRITVARFLVVTICAVFATFSDSADGQFVVNNAPYVTDIDFSSDGKLLAIAHSNGIDVFGMSGGNRINRLESRHAFRSARFSPDDATIIALRYNNSKESGSADEPDARYRGGVWQFGTKESEFENDLEIAAGLYVRSLDYSPDGRGSFAVTGLVEKNEVNKTSLTWWSPMGVPTDVCRHETESTGDYCFFDSGRTVAVIRNNDYKKSDSINAVELFSCGDYKLKKRIEFADGCGYSVAVDPQGTFAIVGGSLFIPDEGVDDGMQKGRLWRVDLNSSEIVRPITSISESPFKRINNVSINATGELCAFTTEYFREVGNGAFSLTPRLQVLNSSTWETEWHADIDSTGAEPCLAFSPDGTSVAFASGDQIELRNSQTGAIERVIVVKQ